MHPIVIAAGGTGGHFFPAEALATTLIARGHRVVLITDARTGARLGPVFSGLEHFIVPGAGLAGRGVAKSAQAAVALAAGVVQARRILGRLDAVAVVGFGGYPSVPPLLAARLLRRRPALVLHEQNAVLGRANRFLVAPATDLLALGFADTQRVPAGVPSRVVGNPVRPAFQALAGTAYVPPEQTIDLLVSGGSLGARVFSDVVPAAIALLADDLRARVRVVQQCRAEDIARVHDAYSSAGMQAELAPFFPDFSDRLAAAHLVIARAGASTCAELAAVGRPAILVPLPGAIDDHQVANAAALYGAHVIPQPDFSPGCLAAVLSDMLSDPIRLTAAAARITACGRPGAARDFADLIEAVIAKAETAR